MDIPGKVCVGVNPVWQWVVCICLYVVVIIMSPHIKGLAKPLTHMKMDDVSPLLPILDN